MSMATPFTYHVGVLLALSALMNGGLYVMRDERCVKIADTTQKSPYTDDSPPAQVIEASSPLLPVEYPLPPVDCDSVEKMLRQGTMEPWEVNELRHNVTLADPSCFDRHFQYFAKAFIPRIHMRQYNLHIPKTGGTSLCRLVRDNGLKAPLKLCRHKALCPFWCNYCATRQPLSCREAVDSPYDFIGNERWLDHDDSLFCSEFAHSISIREPVARAISNVNMWLSQTCFGKRNFTDAGRTERLQIVQSNYLTWSLTAGSSDYPEGFQPTIGHVNMARRMLSRFDFIINVESSICFEDIIGFMGFHKTEIEHHRVASGNYSSSYNRENYSMLNALDVMVYEFAQELIRIDCDFFRRLKEEFDIPKAPYRPPTPAIVGRTANRTSSLSLRKQRFWEFRKKKKRSIVDPYP